MDNKYYYIVESIMSEEFMKLKLRCPKESEIQLIKKLAGNGDKSVDLTNLKVSEMEDGHMGSLLLFVDGKYIRRESPIYVSECQFKDVDGVVVIATLYSDVNGVLSEVDIWKTNFEPLIALPSSYDV